MASATWSSLFGGDASQIRKALYGSVLVQEYNPSNNYASYSPFDPATGGLSSTLLTTDGWLDCGFTDDNGIIFTPTFSTTPVDGWQSRDDLRTDITKDTEEAAVVFLQSNPLIDALRESLPLPSGEYLQPGQSGYSLTKPLVPTNRYRSLLFLGVDGNNFVAKLYPRALMIKPDKQEWNAKNPQQSALTFQAYPDKTAGYSRKTFRDGPDWRSEGIPAGVLAPTGLTATAVAGTKANLSWTAPTGGTAPYTYVVFRNGTQVGSTSVTFAGTPSAPTAVVSNLTVGNSYTFNVQATDADGYSSPTSISSAAITAIA